MPGLSKTHYYNYNKSMQHLQGKSSHTQVLMPFLERAREAVSRISIGIYLLPELDSKISDTPLISNVFSIYINVK